MGIADLSSLTNPLTDVLDGILPDISIDGIVPDLSVPNLAKPDCNTNVLKCGPPRIDFIGGGSDLIASGSPVVNLLGQIIGVAISDGGSGYKEPPALSFVDGCDNGYGAGGYAVVENGIITKVVMTDGGQDYIPNTTETDIDGNVKEVTPDPNANYDGSTSYVTSVSDIIVENAGFGYNDTDTITISGGGNDTATGGAEAELNVVNGRIAGVNITNGGFGFTSLPELTINSDTGAIARLSPVLEFTRVDDAEQLAEISQDAVVTVISCIEK